MKQRGAKKIVFITGYYPFHPGGAEYQAFMLAEKLKQAHAVSFIFRNHWNKKANSSNSGYKLHALQPFPFSLKRINENFLLEMGKMEKMLKKLQPDIIYLRGANAYSMSAAVHAQKHNTTLIWHVAHDRDLTPLPYADLFLKPLAYIEKNIIRYGLKNSTYIITQTHHQHQLLKQHFNLKSHMTIPNWHPLPETTPKADNPINVLWIANWRPFKQPKIFIRLAQALGTLAGVRFIMIGRNHQYPLIKAKALAAGVEVTGELTNENVNALLSRSHLLVNTSQMEGFSNTFIQAWMRHIPVVSLHVDPDDVLKKKHMGLHSRTFAQLVADTRRLIIDCELRNRMGQNAAIHAFGHHSLNNIKKILPLFTK